MLDSDANTSPLLKLEEGISTTEKTASSYSSSVQDEDVSSEDEQHLTNLIDDETKNNGIGRWGAIAMVINLYVGTGVVTLPASIALGGWFSLVLVTIVGVLACATGLQIVDGFEKTNSQTYYAFAFAAGGRVAEKFTLAILTFYFVSSNIFHSLIIMDTLHSTFKYFDLADQVSIYVISVTVMTILSLGLIAFDILLPRGLTVIGEWGTAFVVLLIICLFGTFFQMIYKNETDPGWDEGIPPLQHQTFNWEHITGVLANAVTNYSGHGGLPDIYRRMSKKDDFRFVIYVSFTFMTTMFVALGAVSYAALGNEVARYPNVLSYIPHVWPGHKAKAEAIILLMNSLLIIKVLLTQPVFVDLALEYYEHWLVSHGHNCARRIGMCKKNYPSPTYSNNASTFVGTKAAKISIYFIYFILTVVLSVLTHFFLGESAVMHYLPWETTIFALSEVYLFPSTFFLLILWKYYRPISNPILTRAGIKFVLSWALFANCLYFSIMFAC